MKHGPRVRGTKSALQKKCKFCPRQTIAASGICISCEARAAEAKAKIYAKLDRPFTLKGGA